MNYFDVLTAVGIMAGLGLIFGLILSYAAKIFAVESDPRIDEIREALPGANCGACGEAGCDAYAAAVAAGSAAIDACIPGGAQVAAELAVIMGVSVAAPKERQIAQVCCEGNCHNAKEKYLYIGVDSCLAAAQIFNGHKICEYGCLGHGDCMKACPFNAIEMVDRLAVIDPEKCRACEKCIAACPKQLINMQAVSKRFTVRCRSQLPGMDIRKICSVGCIGCTRCVKACPTNTIIMDQSVALILPDGCINCGACASVCPTKAITERADKKENCQAS